MKDCVVTAFPADKGYVQKQIAQLLGVDTRLDNWEKLVPLKQ